jgi:hypothetical protein
MRNVRLSRRQFVCSLGAIGILAMATGCGGDPNDTTAPELPGDQERMEKQKAVRNKMFGTGGKAITEKSLPKELLKDTGKDTGKQ